MKKITLFVLLTNFALWNTTNAQISFEASEGYTLGTLAGQNGWGGTAAVHIAEISTDYANPGTNSLKIQGNNGTVHSSAGAISASNAMSGDVLELTYNAYFTAAATAGDESDFFFSAQGATQITSRMRFTYDGKIMVVDFNDAGTLAYIDSGATFATGQWYSIRVVHDFVNGSIEYFVNGTSIYVGSVVAATNIVNMAITNDNYDSSAYFDNIRIFDPALSVKENDFKNVSVTPNPASNLVSVSNAGSISKISLVDINGRTVLSNDFSSISDAQVNISDLSQGIYMMNIVSDKGITTRKLIKE